MHLSALLDSPLVHSTVSRLVYDCNRPPESPTAMPERSEDTVIPGNIGLTDAARQERITRVYRPFEALLATTLDERTAPPVMLTIHSFTPVFRGVHRTVEIGFLYDSDSRLADALLDIATGYAIARNEPYGPADGVTHTLRHHALPCGLLNVMIEVRNDLIATPSQCSAMAETLADWINRALDRCAIPQAARAGA